MHRSPTKIYSPVRHPAIGLPPPQTCSTTARYCVECTRIGTLGGQNIVIIILNKFTGGRYSTLPYPKYDMNDFCASVVHILCGFCIYIYYFA